MIIRICLLLVSLLFIPQVHAKPVIMVFGDSLSAGFGLPKGKGWVDLLQQRINEKKLGYEVVNASISGDTTSSGVSRIDHALKTHHPVITIIELGGNDGLRGLSLKEMRNNLQSMVRSVKNKGAKVLIIGMQLPPNYGLAFTRRFEKVFRQVAEKEDTFLVPFFLQGFESNMRYFQPDRIHPNVKGQPLMLNNVWPELSRMLD